MNDRKAELSLRQVLAETLVLRVLLANQIAVVVADLKVQAQHRRQFAVVFGVVAEQLHQADGQHEQAARLANGHLLVLQFRWAREIVTPVDLHALAAVQLEQLLSVHFGRLSPGSHTPIKLVHFNPSRPAIYCTYALMVQLLHLLQCQKASVVGRIDRAGDTVNGMSDRNTSAEQRVVLDVIDPALDTVVFGVNHPQNIHIIVALQDRCQNYCSSHFENDIAS